MGRNTLEEQLDALSSLGDPTRRRLYLYVASRPEGVGRDEAAEVTGINRALAAFHLDRLTADALLVADYRRLTGRSGPGAGRPAKIYRRSERQLAVNLPPKNYELLARLLAQAAMGGQDASAADGLGETARNLGTTLGNQARREAGARPSRDRLLAAGASVLTDCGFEAAVVPSGLVLRNCPFSPLSKEFTPVVCSMNLAIMQGVVEGLRLKGIEAQLVPPSGRCCVVLRPPGDIDEDAGGMP